MNTFLSMSSFIFPLITFPYISRILLPVGTGKVNFAISFVSYFTMFAQLGIPTYGIRVCAMVRDDRAKLTKVTQELLLINIIMCIISYIVYFIVLFTVPVLSEDRTLYLIVSVNILLTSIGMEWLFKAVEQYTYITIRSLIFKIIAMAAMFLLVHEQKDYVIYGGIAIFAGCASNIMNFLSAHRLVDMKPVGHYDLKPHLKAVGVFFAMSCATTIYLHLDTIMLKFMATDADVGYYGAATKFKTILTSLVTSLGAVLLPRVSYYVKQKKMKEFQIITKKALSFVFLLAIPLMFYFIIFAKESIFFISGKEYGGAILPMQIIMPTLLLIGITNILGMQILIPLGKEKIVLISEIVGAVADLILNAILIPFFQSEGAAIGTLVAEFLVLVVQYYYLRDSVTEAFIGVQYLKIFPALAGGIAVSFAVKFLQLNGFLTLVVSSLLFFAVYGGILILLKEPLVIGIIHQMKNKLVKRKKNETAGNN